jgi:hypothetical protein
MLDYQAFISVHGVHGCTYEHYKVFRYTPGAFSTLSTPLFLYQIKSLYFREPDFCLPLVEFSGRQYQFIKTDN